MSVEGSARVPQWPVDPQFVDRWSPRALDPSPLPRHTLMSLLEAARWAPSCFNEQPWLFVAADQEPWLSTLKGLLSDANRRWAQQAPVLLVLFAKKTFSHSGKTNRWAWFDCGAAWMSLALQARKLGLFAHAMAGFDRERAYEATGVSRDEYEAICAIAVGRYGDPALLPPDVAAREHPTPRDPLDEHVVLNGWWGGRGSGGS